MSVAKAGWILCISRTIRSERSDVVTVTHNLLIAISGQIQEDADSRRIKEVNQKRTIRACSDQLRQDYKGKPDIELPPTSGHQKI